MDHISKLAQRKELTPQSTDASKSTTAKQETYSITIKHVDKLFIKFREIYLSKFRAVFPDESVLVSTKQTWLSGLKAFEPEDLARGLSKCMEKHKDWPPSLVEFYNLCKKTPCEIGLPTHDQAYAMAIARNWEFPIVWFAMQDADSFKVRSLPEKEAKARFGKAYNKMLDQAYNGRVFEIPQTQIALPREATYTQEEIETAKDEFKQIIQRGKKHG